MHWNKKVIFYVRLLFVKCDSCVCPNDLLITKRWTICDKIACNLRSWLECLRGSDGGDIRPRMRNHTFRLQYGVIVKKKRAVFILSFLAAVENLFCHTSCSEQNILEIAH